MKSQVKLSYNSGWKLSFPVNENAPRLFLEWLRDMQAGRTGRITFSIKTQQDDAEVLNDIFIVRFDNILREDAVNCQNYIKANL